MIPNTFVGVPRRKVLSATKQSEGTRLKKLRIQMGMTVRELGKEFKVGFSSISQWENGEHTLPGSVLKLIEIYEQKLKRPSRERDEVDRDLNFRFGTR